MRTPAACLAWLICLLWAPLAAQTQALSAAEIRGIASLGPWPPPLVSDPSNRVSTNIDAVELGQRLFFDSRLSPIGYIGCVSCHQPDRAWTDRLPRAHGLANVNRNTQSLNNLLLQHRFGWVGASDSLWMASVRPILDAREMDSNPAHVRHVYAREPIYGCLYQRAFGADAVKGPASDERVLVDTAKALAAYMSTLVTGRTPFDALRDAVVQGQPVASIDYPPAALRGLKVFVGRGRCIACHAGANLSDGAFHQTGVPGFVAQRVPDNGLADGQQQLRASRFNLGGPHNDGAKPRPRAQPEPSSQRGAFRTPSLRNVAVTAPYMHNGSLDSLRDVVLHYASTPPRVVPKAEHALPQAMHVQASDADDLLAFLQTLTDTRGENRGLPLARVTACDMAGETTR